MVGGAVIAVLTVAGTLLMRSVPETVSALLFILVVMVEVVVAPIPGGAIAYMGAARFGFWQAWPLLYIGNAIGTTLVFFLARRHGTPLFRERVSEATRRRFDYLLQHHLLLLWLVYSIPLMPVDVLSVLAGLSSISAKKFLMIALSGYFTTRESWPSWVTSRRRSWVWRKRSRDSGSSCSARSPGRSGGGVTTGVSCSKAADALSTGFRDASP